MFIGYQETPLLWRNDAVLGLRQFQPEATNARFNHSQKKSLRLGNWAEQFVFFQLHHQKDCEVLFENLQIKDDKTTIGELDVLFNINNKLLHLEIIYKFYLYHRSSNQENDLNYWVGPNRKDSLIYKLNKLKNKQLPLLYNNHTQRLLNKSFIDTSKASQFVMFKAQLFLPYGSIEDSIDLGPLNKACIMGYYISFNQIDVLNNSHIYIPRKLEWLIEPYEQVDWMDFNNAKTRIEELIQNNRSPMIWVLERSNRIKKYFVTWWQ